LFADDTNLFCSGKDLQELESIVNTQLIGVQEWLTVNQLTLIPGSNVALSSCRTQLVN